jgi:hypothetical protein
MGIVTMGAKQIRSLAPCKIPTPLPVDAGFPVVINIAVTFATEAVAMVVTDELSVVESQFVLVSGIVAVKAPPHRFSMMEHDILMSLFQLSPLNVDLHGGVTVTAGIHPFCKGRRGDRKLLSSLFGEDWNSNP